MTGAEQVISEAHHWIGTPFHHQGRVMNTAHKQGGCDCIGLILGVCRALKIRGNHGFIHDFDVFGYGREPDGFALKRELDRHLLAIAVADIAPADVILFRFDQNPQHVGIVSAYPKAAVGVIHCYAQARKVVEHVLDDYWKEKIVAAYRFPFLN